MERTISNIQQPQIFNIEKIVSYLSLYKDNLEQLYAWDASFKKLVELNILTPEELTELDNQTPFIRTLEVKNKVGEAMRSTRTNNPVYFKKLVQWVIKDWGGVIGLNDENIEPLVNNFIGSEKPPFKAISSSSKVGAYLYPEKNAIYDSRVAYALNWIILSQNAGNKFLPMPQGRNSKLTAFDIDVLIRLKNVEKYKPNSLSDLDTRQYIKSRDNNNYISEKNAYYEMNKLMLDISSKLWQNPKYEPLFLTGMLLFSIATTDGDFLYRMLLEVFGADPLFAHFDFFKIEQGTALWLIITRMFRHFVVGNFEFEFYFSFVFVHSFLY